MKIFSKKATRHALSVGAMGWATAASVFFLVIFGTPAIAQNLSPLPEVSAGVADIQTTNYLSPVTMAPMVFTGLGASWEEILPQNATVTLSVRFFENNHWSDWYILQPDLDGKEEADPLHPTAFIPVNPTKMFQYKMVLEGADGNASRAVQNLQFTYVNSSSNERAVQGRGMLIAASLPSSPAVQTKQVALDTTLSGIHVISRAEWGADESLRVYKSTNPAPVLVKTENDFTTKYADELKIVKTLDTDSQGNKLTWPEQFPEKITKIVIHHTASTKDLKDPMKAIRDIYYFHAISRGWGDIGYNYIIDQQGNIYEGRAGGDGVVGAHAGRGNVGSIGIAVLGNYTDSDVPEPVIHSLVALIRAKTTEYNIDPTGSSMFRGENLPNVMGHRDIMSTSCPGEKLYEQLPAIRLAAKSSFKPVVIDRGKNLAVNEKYDFQIAQNIPLYEFNPGETKSLLMSLKNSGTTAWGKDTYFVLNRDANANNYFLTGGVVRSQPAGKAVQPGQSAMFTINVQSGYKGGFTALEAFPMVDGKIKVEKYLSIPVLIKPAIFDYEVTGMSLPKPYLKIGEQAAVQITLKNTGTVTWKRDGQNRFALGADMPRDHVNKLLLNPSNRLAKLVENEVKPGETGHLSFQLKASRPSGPYREFFTPLVEGVTWFQNKNNHLDLYVYEKEFQGILAGTSPAGTFVRGGKKTIWFDIKNTGGAVWKKSGVNSLSFEVRNLKNVKIEGLAMQQDQVAPGETAHVSFTLNVPTTEGFYALQIKPKIGANYLLPQARNYNFMITKNMPIAPAGAIILPTGSTTPSQPAGQPAPQATKIRIALGFRGNPVITSDGPFHIESNGNVLAKLSLGQTATVSYENNLYVIKTASQSYTSAVPPRFVPDGGILQIQNWNRTSSGNSSVVYNRFRGVLEPHWYNDQVVTINELPIEDYLKGTGETKDSQPYEKLKAIIVVSRSYALFYVKTAEKFPGAPYNLTDDPETSQKYVGFGSEKYSPNTLRAIADTAGEVVTYGGKLIKTPYFSSDDGRTRSAEEVWGWKDTPYLISVPDIYCTGMPMNGHGVGLSGCGSLGMANAGKTYQEIIKYYYQGVDIQKL